MIAMANLEAKFQISPWQLALLIIATAFGPGIIIGGRVLAEAAGVHEWLVLLMGAMVYCGFALLMLKLGLSYPNENLLEYMPRLWGRFLGNFINLVYIGLHIGYFIVTVGIFSRIITVFMFDRTPPEILAMAMIIACTYCAVQDFGIILRVLQFVVLSTVPMFILIFFTGVLSAQPEHLLPVKPRDFTGLLATVPSLWSVYAGYEIILLVLPLLACRTTKPGTAVAAAFGFMGVIHVTFALITIAVLSAENAKNLAFPAMEVVRFVELPGTFLERLETYLLGAWIPNVFTSLTIFLYVAAFSLMKFFRQTDHRPWVLLLGPWLLFCSGFFSDVLTIIEPAVRMLQKVAWLLSAVIVPASLVLTWWKKRRGNNGSTG